MEDRDKQNRPAQLNKGKKEKQSVSAEHFKRMNKKIGSASIEKCILTDAEKIKNGTHKWVREGKTARLVKI